LMTIPLIAVIGAAIVLQTGCVVGRRSFELPVPSPSDPSMPSIDGDVTKVSVQEKNRMIGRQRNGFGYATGDMALLTQSLMPAA